MALKLICSLQAKHHATNRLSPPTSNGTFGVSPYILLTSIDDNHSPRGQRHRTDNDQRGTSSAWYSSLAKIPGNSLLRSQSDTLSRISGANNKQRYQPYDRPVPLQRYAQNSDELRPANINDGSTSRQTNALPVNVPNKCTPAEIHHPSRDHSPTSPSRILVKANHYVPVFRTHSLTFPTITASYPHSNLIEKFFVYLPSAYHIAMKLQLPDSNDYYRRRHDGLLSRYQLPTLPTSSSFHPSRLAPNFRGFSDDRLPLAVKLQ